MSSWKFANAMELSQVPNPDFIGRSRKRLRPLGLSAMSVTAVSPVGMAKVRLAETNWTGPFVVRPLDDKVFTHVVLLILKSHTFIKAEDTVKAILVASEYLTQTYGLHKYNNIYIFFFFLFYQFIDF